MKKWLAIWPMLTLAATAWAELSLANPKDKLITFDEIVRLQVKTNAPAIKVNEIKFRPDGEGNFTCGLVLHRGKNFVSVSDGGDEKNIRILRLITYPDIEEEYNGKKHWARAQIVYLSALGMIEGYPDGNFHPANPVSRSEFSTWLAKAKKLPVEPNLTVDPFFDVPKEHWRAPYVKAVTDAGYLSPYSKHSFGLDDPISRREAAEMIVRSEGLGTATKITQLFRDVPKEEKGSVPIYTAHEGGLVIGVSSKLPIYDPERALTRAEAAMLISRFTIAQNGIRYLYSFDNGYLPATYCRLEIAPVITGLTVEPGKTPINQTSTIKLRARLASREAFAPIAKVKADLSPIGGQPDAEMFNDGTHGDETAGDDLYSLNFSFTPQQSGQFLLGVVATDQLGWQGKSEAPLQVTK